MEEDVQQKVPHIWLAYVSYPVTTAAYLERALRKICRVTTIGPRIPEGNIVMWSLENMKVPIVPHDIETDGAPDMRILWDECPPDNRPDLYLWVESVYGYFPKNIASLPCKKACYLIDMHLNLHLYTDFARQFDFAFIVHRQFVPNISEIVPRSHWLPVACDPAVHHMSGKQKQHDISFVGSIHEKSRRFMLLELLKQHIPVHVERCFWDEMAALFSESKIVFNNCVDNDLNMRFFEVLSCGSLLMADMAYESGQNELFVAGEDYALYDEENLVAVARYYLAHEQIREKIAQRGQRLVHAAHTYDHRVRDLLNVVFRGKSDTWSATELREQSLIESSITGYNENVDAIVRSAQELISRLITNGNFDAAVHICNSLQQEYPDNVSLASLARFSCTYAVKKTATSQPVFRIAIENSRS